MTDSKAGVFQSYLDNIQAKTGHTPDEFVVEARERGLIQSRDIIAWLKADYGLGLGHARAIDYVIRHGNEFTVRSASDPEIETPGALILDGSSLTKRSGLKRRPAGG